MSARSVLLALVASLAVVALGYSLAAQDAKITYKTKAKRADLVLQEIAGQTGLTIETNEDAKLHYLVISVEDVPIEALLKQIADVTSSRWNTAAERWVLAPDETARRKEQDEKNARRVEIFKRGQASIKKELEKKPGNPEDEDYEWPFFEAPAEKALAQLSLLINPNEVAQLEQNGRIVFSTVPNRMQKPMNNAQVGRILATLVTEHNEFAKQKIKENEEMKKAMAEAGEVAGMDWFEEKYYVFESAPAKALIILELDGAEFGLPGENANAKFVVYDQKGQAIVNSSIAFSPEMYDRSYLPGGPDSEEMVEEKQEAKPISDDDRTPITYSDDSKAFNAMSMQEDFTLNLPEPVLAILRDPVSKDVLSLHMSDTLMSIAKVKKLNVVANLADSEAESMFGGMFDEGEAGETIGSAMRAMTDGERPQAVVKDGWMIVRPRDPITARTNRQDREVLKRFVDTAVAEGRGSLTNLSNFALDSPHPMVNGMSFLYLIAFAPNSLQGLMGDTMSWDALKFYGSLVPPQKNALRAGGRLTFGELSQQSRGILSKMAFASDANIKTLDAMKKDEALPFFLTMFSGMMGQEKKSYAEEPTELMPNGLPGAGWVELSVSGETVATTDGGPASFFLGLGGLGAGELAFLEIMGEMAQGEEMEEFMKVPDALKLGTRENLKFTFWLSPEAGLVKTLIDDRFDKSTKAIPRADLPAEFRAEINKRKQQIKDSPWGRMMGGIGVGPSA